MHTGSFIATAMDCDKVMVGAVNAWTNSVNWIQIRETGGPLSDVNLKNGNHGIFYLAHVSTYFYRMGNALNSVILKVKSIYIITFKAPLKWCTMPQDAGSQNTSSKIKWIYSYIPAANHEIKYSKCELVGML